MHKDRDSAYKYITMAYNKANIGGKEDGIALYTNTIMGEYFLNHKEYDKAELFFNRALKINEKQNGSMLITPSISIMISGYYMNIQEIKRRHTFI